VAAVQFDRSSTELRERIAQLARREGAVWLDTSSPLGSPSGWSYFAFEPAVWLRGLGSILDMVPGPKGDRGWLARILRADPGPGPSFDRLAVILQKLHISPSTNATEQPGPDFQGGLAGCFSYDLGRQFETVPDTLASNQPWDFLLGLYDEVLAFREDTGEAIYYRLPGGDTVLLEALGNEATPQQDRATAQPFNHHAGTDEELRPDLDEDTHRGHVETIREHIRNGDVYQVNLTLRFTAPCSDPDAPLASFLRLRHHNPSPFGAYLDLPDETLVSASPECFLRVDRTGLVESRPIKGTRRRGLNGSRDDLNERRALLESHKDRAELSMIVDLVRNDLGRVCIPGSVSQQPELKAEAHPTVWHLVGDVQGKLSSSHQLLTLLRASFPPGSCIGAPKIRAMGLIEQLEASRRGPYTGALGWIGLNGTMGLSVAIRTLLFRDGQVCYGVGGGIVYESEPRAEWEEALLKGRALCEALRPTQEQPATNESGTQGQQSAQKSPNRSQVTPSIP